MTEDRRQMTEGGVQKTAKSVQKLHPRCSTTVEDSLQISSFMQNKPNFQKSQMNVSVFSKMAYENKSNWTLSENKPKPISEKPK